MAMDLYTKTFQIIDRHAKDGNLPQMPGKDYPLSMALKPGPNIGRRPSFCRRHRNAIEILTAWAVIGLVLAAVWTAIFSLVRNF